MRASMLWSVNVVEATVEVKNRLGLHLRAASTLAKALSGYDAEVTIGRGKNMVNARSVTSLIMLGAAKGTKLKLKANGNQAKEAIAAAKELFEANFGED